MDNAKIDQQARWKSRSEEIFSVTDFQLACAIRDIIIFMAVWKEVRDEFPQALNLYKLPYSQGTLDEAWVMMGSLGWVTVDAIEHSSALDRDRSIETKIDNFGYSEQVAARAVHRIIFDKAITQEMMDALTRSSLPTDLDQQAPEQSINETSF